VISDSTHKVEENFWLKDEVMYILETLSVNCLGKFATLNFKHDETLPDKVCGDIFKFRLALSSIAEFALK